MRFYLPSWNGDFRLEGGEHHSTLTLIKPTPGERLVVGQFMQIAAAKGWIDPKLAPKGKSAPYQGKDKIELDASLAKASKPMIKLMRPVDRTLTAIMFSDGRLSIIEGATSKALKEIGEKVGEATSKWYDLGDVDKKLAELKQAEADAKREADRLEKERKKEEKRERKRKDEARAVSVRRPTPSCPSCLPGAVGPASEVLLDFLTPEQHEDWSKDRAIVVEGEITGHRYLLAHRHSRTAAKMGRICMDLDEGDGEVVHFHDWLVPPEEEVLAAKLILENREAWLRNEATCLGDFDDRFILKNPFGDVLDGTESADIAIGLGRSILAQMPIGKQAEYLAKNMVVGGKTYEEWGLTLDEDEVRRIVSMDASDVGLLINGPAPGEEDIFACDLSGVA